MFKWKVRLLVHLVCLGLGAPLALLLTWVGHLR